MARITVEDCLKETGSENRFELIHLAVKRIKQHRKGAPYLVRSKNKEAVATLREIAAGAVTFDNVNNFIDAEDDSRYSNKKSELESIEFILQKK